MKGGPLVVSLFQLENFSLIWRRYHYGWRALMAIEQWWFYSVAHLLWHNASVYNDHLREPVTLSHFAERLAVEQSLPAFYDSGLSRLGFVRPNLPTYNNFVLLRFHSSSWVGKTNSPEFDIVSNSSFPCVIFRLSQWNCCNHWGCWGVA